MQFRNVSISLGLDEVSTDRNLGRSTVQSVQQAMDELDLLRTKLDCALLIDGDSLQVSLDMYASQADE